MKKYHQCGENRACFYHHFGDIAFYMEQNQESPLKKWRESKGWNQDQAGAALENPRTGACWQRWENGLRQPRGVNLTNVKKLTGLTSDQILGMAA
jgi:hypothetical protein